MGSIDPQREVQWLMNDKQLTRLIDALRRSQTATAVDWQQMIKTMGEFRGELRLLVRELIAVRREYERFVKDAKAKNAPRA